ncbi:hypothetical protein GCM10011359_24220 [Nesterenkonia alkaliphila]|nr:hypothetical protein GCM10011359_24220 [Nesterenkonia alkaliphila]
MTGCLQGSARTGQSYQRQRVLALDAARGLAVVGMIAVNIGPRGGESLSEVLYRLPYGRASLLFVLLGGIGMSLLTRRTREENTTIPWAAILWRVVILLIVGLALEVPDHGVAVILPTYASLILLAAPLIRAPSKLLIVFAGITAGIGPLIWILRQMLLGAELSRAPVTEMDSFAAVLDNMLLTGPYPLVVWSAPFLLGMWLGRQNLRSSVASTRMIIWGAAATVAGRAASQILVAFFGEPQDNVGWDRLSTSVGHSQMPLWLISGIGSAVLLLGLLLKIQEWNRWWLRPFLALGVMAFTAYVGHLFILAAVIRPGPQDLLEGAVATAGTVLALVAFTSLWYASLGRGPMEMVLQVPRL